MRILLLGVGAVALAAVGWICWRATAETREWRELLAVNRLSKRTPAVRVEFDRLVRRRIPEEIDPYNPWEMLVLEGPEGQRRILIGFSAAGARSEVHLHVFDEGYRRRSVTSLPVEIHPCGLHLQPGKGPDPWSFGIDSLTPGSPLRSFFVLKADYPVRVGIQEQEP